MKKYKVGIIGAGKIVENSHLPVLKNIPGVSIEWVYDLNNKRSQLLSKMYQVKPITDWEKQLQNIDLCLITTPYGVRAPYLQTASTLNKCVYVEKPFALTVYEHRQMSNDFLPYALAIGFQRRVYKIVYELKQLIESNILGKLESIDFKQGYFTLKGGSSYLSDSKLSGGGVIIESAIHSLDQILLFTDASDIVVTDTTYIQKERIDYDSTIRSTLITPGGNIEVTTQISTLQNLVNGLILRFANGIIQCNLSPDAVINLSSKIKGVSMFCLNVKDALQHTKFATSINGSFYIFWQTFIDGLNKKESNLTSASNSLLTTKWIEKIYERFR